jgi:hypothetical protein
VAGGVALDMRRVEVIDERLEDWWLLIFDAAALLFSERISAGVSLAT